MKIEVKPKIVRRFLIIFWSCFFTIWFFLKKFPEIKAKFTADYTSQLLLIADNLNNLYMPILQIV